MSTFNTTPSSEIAKKHAARYEAEKQSNVPGYIVILPSKGRCYPKSSPLRSGKIEMYYMTAYHEDILSNKTFIESGVVLEKLLDSTIKTPVSVNELIKADREWLIVETRINNYSSKYEVGITTPDKQQITKKLDLSKIKVGPELEEGDENGEYEYKIEDLDTVITYKYPTISSISKDSEGKVVTSWLNSIICSVNGERDANTIEEFIKYKFLRKYSSKFRKHVLDTTPEIDYTIDVKYKTESGQEDTFTAGFQFGPDFLWD